MKINENGIKYVADHLTNFLYKDNLQATKELMELFDKLSAKPLDTVDKYVKMYDDNFFTFETWEELIESEREQPYGLTEKECKEQMNKSIWQLSCGWYVQYV